MTRLGLSLQGLAKLCGVNVRTARRWRNGETKMPLSARRLLAMQWTDAVKENS